jgi:hypothetical protein
MRHYRYEEDERFLPAYKKEVNEDGDVKVFFFLNIKFGIDCPFGDPKESNSIIFKNK